MKNIGLPIKQAGHTAPRGSIGFTLVESIMAVAVFIVLSIGVSTVTLTIMRSYRQQSASLTNVDQATIVASRFTNELRNASYGNDGAYPLNSAGPAEIVFFSTVGAEPNQSNRIRYYLSGTSLYKGITAPSGSPPSYDLGSETTDLVQNSVINYATTSIPLFYYYDGDYGGGGDPLSQPVNINDVKFVKINLIVLKQPGISTTTSFNLNTGATLRNLKNNLGN